METEQQRAIHQFGVFELDLRTGELRKHGVRLKLQQQPLQVLAILIERAGEVVTREEIQKALWPEDTYVDFDNAINSSIRKLREALGDNADSPRFIETLPRRGYRFVYPVSQGAAAKAVSQIENATPAHKGRRWWRAVAALILAGIAAGLGFWFLKSTSNGNGGNALLKAVPFTAYPGYEVLPSFSPDGTRVAFTWQQPRDKYPDVYIKLLGPGQPVGLSSAGGFGPAWSPDGRFVAFLRAIDVSHAAVVVIPALGGQEREITQVTFDAMFIFSRQIWAIPAPFLAWSPDGKWLLTVAQRAAGKAEPHAIIRISVETGEREALTSPSAATLGDGGLALSPDGKRLAFTRDTALWARDIYIAPVSADLLLTGKPQRITFDHKAIGGIAWTGDGRSLVFSSSRNGKPELWELALEPGSHPVRLHLTDDEVTDVAISGDGKRLVYSHRIDDQNIWRASLNGQHVDGASNFISSTRRETGGRYSPDGKRIVFESDRSGSEEIWICNADGSDPVQLTDFGNAWAGAPRWSPDGAQIAFEANAAGDWDIYVVSSGGGKPRRLTKDGADEGWPIWSRDGKWIYYYSNRSKQGQIWKLPANGGPEVQVTKNAGLWSRANESADGKDLYFGDAHSLWKVPVTGGDEREVDECSDFVVVKNGVYCVGYDSWHSTFPLYFLDFKTKRKRAIGVLPGPLGWSFEVSPDERWVIYGKLDRVGSELMLVENFQ